MSRTNSCMQNEFWKRINIQPFVSLQLGSHPTAHYPKISFSARCPAPLLAPSSWKTRFARRRWRRYRLEVHVLIAPEGLVSSLIMIMLNYSSPNAVPSRISLKFEGLVTYSKQQRYRFNVGVNLRVQGDSDPISLPAPSSGKPCP
jgi:hypothetical protein